MLKYKIASAIEIEDLEKIVNEYLENWWKLQWWVSTYFDSETSAYICTRYRKLFIQALKK